MAMNLGIGLGMGSGGGASSSLRSATFLDDVVITAALKGAYSHTIRLRSAHSGAICKLKVGATTQDFSPNANGVLDYAAVIAFRDANGGGTILVNTVYNQGTLGTGATLDAIAPSDALSPILDPANYESDGVWPASFVGYAGETGEVNQYLDIGTGLTHNRANYTYCAVIRATTNVGTQGVPAVANAQIGIMSQSQLSANLATNEMVIGDDVFTGNFGAGSVWGATPTKVYTSTAASLVSHNRNLVYIGGSFGTTIDGQAGPNINININGVYNSTVAATGRTSASTTSGRIGSRASTSQTGQAMLWFGSMYYGDQLEVASQRTTMINQAKTVFGITTGQTKQVLAIGSSTIAGYVSHADGVMMQLQRQLGTSVVVDGLGHAGTPTTTVHTNRVAISALKRSGFTKNIALLYNIRNDLVNTADTATTIYNSYVKPTVQQLVADGWIVLVGSQARTVTAGTWAGNQAGFDAELVTYAGLVNAGQNAGGANQYTAVDIWAATNAGIPHDGSGYADFTNTTYYSVDQVHKNQSGGIPISVAAWLAAINTVL